MEAADGLLVLMPRSEHVHVRLSESSDSAASGQACVAYPV